MEFPFVGLVGRYFVYVVVCVLNEQHCHAHVVHSALPRKSQNKSSSTKPPTSSSDLTPRAINQTTSNQHHPGRPPLLFFPLSPGAFCFSPISLALPSFITISLLDNFFALAFLAILPPPPPPPPSPLLPAITDAAPDSCIRSQMACSRVLDCSVVRMSCKFFDWGRARGCDRAWACVERVGERGDARRLVRRLGAGAGVEA